LPSKGISRPLKPELIELSGFLGYHGITRDQLVDLAILIGTDFNEGVKGIGPKTALKLIKRHGSLEALPNDLKEKLPHGLETLRSIFLRPEVTSQYSTSQGSVDEEGLLRFLCDERGFAQERVKVALERLRRISKRTSKSNLEQWMR
jgi:flap endonuclease-1